MRIAVCPGSFDPPTNGHLDIIKRAAALFDHVIVAVMSNYDKKNIFSSGERCEMLNLCIEADKLLNVSVEYSCGLLADFAKEKNACAIVKGLRTVTDFDYESRIAVAIKKIAPELETVFLMSSETNISISSGIVRSVAEFGGDISNFVPPLIKSKIIEKFNYKKQ